MHDEQPLRTQFLPELSEAIARARSEDDGHLLLSIPERRDRVAPHEGHILAVHGCEQPTVRARA